MQYLGGVEVFSLLRGFLTISLGVGWVLRTQTKLGCLLYLIVYIGGIFVVILYLAMCINKQTVKVIAHFNALTALGVFWCAKHYFSFSFVDSLYIGQEYLVTLMSLCVFMVIVLKVLKD